MNSTQNPNDKVWENQRKILSRELKLGHFVARLSSPWHETPFLIQGFTVGDQQELQWIQEHCDWVVIDIEKSRNTTELKHAIEMPQLQVTKSDLLVRKSMTQKSMKASLSSYLNLSEQTNKLSSQFQHLKPGDVRSTVSTIIGIAQTLNDNLPALVWLTRIKHEDHYTAEHCINVCILAMGLASTLGWDIKQSAQVGVAGLLHDLGKIDLDMELVNKPGKLSDEEFDVLKKHPKLGFDRLSSDKDLTGDILSGVLDHHERPDGRGYPSGKTADQIGDFAKVVSIVDAYDAITSDRVYQKARSHHEAMSILWGMRDQQFDGKMVEAFIQFLGWVTPGTLVSLSSGDIAVVVQGVEGHRLYPKVRILMPTNQGYALGANWDLSTMEELSSDQPRVHIANVLPDGYQGIRLEEYVDNLFN